MNPSLEQSDQDIPEARLADAATAIAAPRRGRRHGQDNALLQDARLVRWLRLALRATGLYERGVRNALRPVERHIRMECAALPPALDGFRILHLSDLHIDGMGPLAETLAAMLCGISADLCVLTGDYRFDPDGPCEPVYGPLATVLQSVRARHGTFAILGNHDAPEIGFALERMGAVVLVNESVEIRAGGARFWLMGVDDTRESDRDQLTEAASGVPRDAFRVLLAHTPELYEQAASLNVHVYLCGHTHAGQFRLPWVGPVLLNAACPRAYGGGHWRHRQMHGYTSAGAGCSLLPVRYNCPPEIAIVELRAGRQIDNPNSGMRR